MRYAAVIRPARDEDFDAIASITNHYITTTSIHFAFEPVTASSLLAHDRSRYPWFVICDEHEGPVLGYAKAGLWRERAAYAWTTEIGLYVHDSARGKGLGTQLYKALLSELPRRGFRSAVAGITLPNDASIALHQRLGFSKVGVFADAGWKQGAWHAVEWWQKRFATGPEGPEGPPAAS